MARTPAIFPNLRVRDPASEIDWLVRVLGFETHYIAEYNGQIVHAELRMGEQLLFLQPDKADDPYGMHSPQALNGTNQCVCIAVEDVEAVAARVRAASGEMITEPHDTPYGAREFSCRSPDGHVWSIGNYWGQRLVREARMTIKVHHLNESRSQRILWMLEELALDYQIVPYARDAVTRLAPPELKKVHPLGKSPVIEDNGRVVAESGAILDYLARWHGGGKFCFAPDDPQWPDYLHWMHYAEGSAMLPLMLNLYTLRLGEAGAPLQPRIASEIDNHIGYVNESIAGKNFIVGDKFTAADVQLSFVVEVARAFGKLAAFPALDGYITRMHARPAYKRGIERGGPYSMGG